MAFTESDYDRLADLKQTADDRVESVIQEFQQRTNGYSFSTSDIKSINYQSRSREGRSPEMDIEIQCLDYERDGYEIYAPSTILWDLDEAVRTTNEFKQIEAERAKQAEAELKARYAAEAEAHEAALAKRLAKKYGYTKEG